MIKKLFIKNFALIDELDIELSWTSSCIRGFQ